MLRPSDFVMNDFAAVACSQEALCVYVKPYKAYKDGVPGDVAGFTYELVLPSRRFEHISLKVPGNALIAPELFSVPNMAIRIGQIQDFSARWYKTASMDDYALSCTASKFTLIKEVE